MIVALSVAAAYLVFFIIALARRKGRDAAETWLLIFCGFSILLMGIHAALLSDNLTLALPIPNQTVVIGGFILSMLLTGLLTIAYLARPRTLAYAWVLLVVAWGAGVITAEVSGAAPINLAAFTPITGDLALSLEILLGGWLLLSLFLFLLIARTFLQQSLPLYANRMLFWSVIVPPLVLGDVLAAWFVPPWHYVGYVLRLMGTAGAVYGLVTQRIIDLRGSVRWMISRSILTIITGAFVLGGVLLGLRIVVLPISINEQWALLIGLAIVVALILAPVRRFFRWLLRRLISRAGIDPAEAVRLYSQRISGEIELDDLAKTTVLTMNELFATRRSYIVLATQTDGLVGLQAIGQGGLQEAISGQLPGDSVLYQHLQGNRPLIQYDIDYDRNYRDVSDAERRYFRGLGMDIYAPIVDDNALIGMLALGPKINDDPYGGGEIELLSAIANQTVAALENARLVEDLRTLNREISALNDDLRVTNNRLERLDSVKSDFLSIASHELRTPLTQIQGYADLLSEMSERNLLSPDQMMDITSSLRAASQRMGEVISSMLDVSQIDVENMDLSFVETSLASIVKLAIEPYASAIEERDLTLVAKGLRNLPGVYADYQRLVQAFENLITNAIKFTPDGGSINITGEVFDRNEMGDPTLVRVSVQDSGVGIDREHHELIFEKFYRIGPTALHSTGATKYKGGGPGLGLPIAGGIIEGHGGRIWVESDSADESGLPGSTFHVVLPVRPPAMDAHERMKSLQEDVTRFAAQLQGETTE